VDVALIHLEAGRVAVEECLGILQVRGLVIGVGDVQEGHRPKLFLAVPGDPLECRVHPVEAEVVIDHAQSDRAGLEHLFELRLGLVLRDSRAPFLGDVALDQVDDLAVDGVLHQRCIRPAPDLPAVLAKGTVFVAGRELTDELGLHAVPGIDLHLAHVRRPEDVEVLSDQFVSVIAVHAGELGIGEHEDAVARPDQGDALGHVPDDS